MIYQNEKGDTKVDVLFCDDNIWMTQAAIAELYQTKPQNITQHIKNIYEDGELEENRTCKDYLQVQMEGSSEIKSITAELFKINKASEKFRGLSDAAKNGEQGN